MSCLEVNFPNLGPMWSKDPTGQDSDVLDTTCTKDPLKVKFNLYMYSIVIILIADRPVLMFQDQEREPYKEILLALILPIVQQYR